MNKEQILKILKDEYDIVAGAPEGSFTECIVLLTTPTEISVSHTNSNSLLLTLGQIVFLLIHTFHRAYQGSDE